MSMNVSNYNYYNKIVETLHDKSESDREKWFEKLDPKIQEFVCQVINSNLDGTKISSELHNRFISANKNFDSPSENSTNLINKICSIFKKSNALLQKETFKFFNDKMVTGDIRVLSNEFYNGPVTDSDEEIDNNIDISYFDDEEADWKSQMISKALPFLMTPVSNQTNNNAPSQGKKLTFNDLKGLEFQISAELPYLTNDNGIYVTEKGIYLKEDKVLERLTSDNFTDKALKDILNTLRVQY
ncbi:MAG: hypothetical protein WDZ28_05430 [Simkaniaceae bacterium]